MILTLLLFKCVITFFIWVKIAMQISIIAPIKKFDVIGLVKAFDSDGKRCTTVAEFSYYFRFYAKEQAGIRLIEVPAITEELYQCHEISLLNLYIKAQNGMN